MAKQKLVLEDLRVLGTADGEEFGVKKVSGTVEWAIGQTLSIADVQGILRRYGGAEVTVDIVSPKLPKDDEPSLPDSD